jgi:tetratricopeptide (TPR) repeat protein
MRALMLALAFLVALPAGAVAQQDWAKAYDDGKELYEKGNYALAEQKMIEAREHRRAPKQSRRANFSSVLFKPFIPDYYLGLIAAKQGQYQKAERYLQSALDQKLITEGDRADYTLATSTLLRAREEQAKLAVVRPTPPPPVIDKPLVDKPTTPNTGGTGTPTPPVGTQTGTQTGATTTPTPIRVTPPPVVPPAEPAWLAGFRRSMDASRASLRQGRYNEARGSLTAAGSVAGDAASRQQVDQLRREIERDQNAAAQREADRTRNAIRLKDVDSALTSFAALEGLDADHPLLGELRTGIDGLRKANQGIADLARIEKTGVRLFLLGNYKQSAAELERAVGAGVTSQRIYLFLASSRAAEALLAPQAQRAALVEQAKRHYAAARVGNGALAADQRFISRSILQVLQGS